MIRKTQTPRKSRQAKKTSAPRRRAKSKAKPKVKVSAKSKRRSPRQAAQGDAVGPLVVAGVRALGVPLDPAWHAGVTFNLQLILRLAALVDEFALPDHAEPAPVFHA